MDDGGDEDSLHYLLGDPPLPHCPQLQDGGNGDPLLPHVPQPQDGGDGRDWDFDDLLEFGNRLLRDGVNDLFDPLPLLRDDLLGTKQVPPADSSGVNHVLADAADPSSGIGYLQQATIPAAGVYHGFDAPLDDQTPVAVAVASADAAVQLQAVGFESPVLAADDMLSTAPDHETMEVAEMVRVAAQCGEDDAGMEWSEEEHRELLRLFDLYAMDDAVTRCFKIAFHLPKKTVSEVALRCRWLQDKRKTAAGTGSSALGRQLTKAKDNNNTLPGQVKRTKNAKNAKISNKRYPLSKESLDAKSTKELLEDNNKFLKLIEENIKTGQRANIPDYFYYVKTNMDAILQRGSKFGISMTMPPIDEQGLEEILQARLNSLTLTEDA